MITVMARPLKFDRDTALRSAMRVFWSKGFAATSTDDLIAAMGIGRQSMYNAFGDKRTLYLEVLRAYQSMSVAGHLDRLNAPGSALEGIRGLLVGIAVDDDAVRALGCLGVGSVGEFGASDPEVLAIRARGGERLATELGRRVNEAITAGELDDRLDTAQTVDYVRMTMNALQVAARGGSSAEAMRRSAEFAVDRLVAP